MPMVDDEITEALKLKQAELNELTTKNWNTINPLLAAMNDKMEDAAKFR